jgi:hypothetical protein
VVSSPGLGGQSLVHRLVRANAGKLLIQVVDVAAVVQVLGIAA